MARITLFCLTSFFYYFRYCA